VQGAPERSSISAALLWTLRVVCVHMVRVHMVRSAAAAALALCHTLLNMPAAARIPRPAVHAFVLANGGVHDCSRDIAIKPQLNARKVRCEVVAKVWQSRLPPSLCREVGPRLGLPSSLWVVHVNHAAMGSPLKILISFMFILLLLKSYYCRLDVGLDVGSQTSFRHHRFRHHRSQGRLLSLHDLLIISVSSESRLEQVHAQITTLGRVLPIWHYTEQHLPKCIICEADKFDMFSKFYDHSSPHKVNRRTDSVGWLCAQQRPLAALRAALEELHPRVRSCPSGVLCIQLIAKRIVACRFRNG
jgi:hypothetical protein